MSLPVRGAWIEINGDYPKGGVIPSLPVRGAWIEMQYSWARIASTLVAPRAGSVD